MILLKIDLPNIKVTKSVLRLTLAVHIRPCESMASAMQFHACIRPPLSCCILLATEAYDVISEMKSLQSKSSLNIILHEGESKNVQ